MQRSSHNASGWANGNQLVWLSLQDAICFIVQALFAERSLFAFARQVRCLEVCLILLSLLLGFNSHRSPTPKSQLRKISNAFHVNFCKVMVAKWGLWEFLFLICSSHLYFLLTYTEYQHFTSQ